MARRLAVWMSFIATIHIYKGIDKSTIVNRHHAQRLMENVGLDIYKATMALRLNCSAVESKLIETTIIMKTMSTSLLEKNAYCFVGLIDNSQFKVTPNLYGNLVGNIAAEIGGGTGVMP